MCREIVGDALSQFKSEVEGKRKAALAKVRRVPIAALIWGPNPDGESSITQARVGLRDALVQNGHMADFSEDLFDSDSPHSNLIQQAAQAEAYDIVFSLPDSPGSIAEVHDFARLPLISHKVVAFLNSEWNDGYANKSLMELQTYSTCKVKLYESCNLPECVVSTALEMVFALQELFYLNGRGAV